MKLDTVALIGGGRVGAGIAILTARAGLTTILIEKTSELAQEALDNIQREIESQIARWGMTESEKKLVFSNLEAGEDLNRVEAAQLAICAIPDDLTEQKKVFLQLDMICPPETVFVTTSSVLSITELAALLKQPPQMLGLHFLTPILKSKVVEIVRGFQTSNETFTTGKAFISLLGKKGIEVFESPGFITTRLIVPFINEAMYTLMEGVASAEDIDTAIRLGYNFQMGPLELADRIGLDRLLLSMEELFREFGDLKFRPCPVIKKLVRAKQIGVKSGQGFFTYDRETGKKLPLFP